MIRWMANEVDIRESAFPIVNVWIYLYINVMEVDIAI